MEDFYDLLGVSEDASTEEIDRAWRERVRTYHPDVNDDARANAQFKTLKAAHEVLASETERAAYDRMGHETYVREQLGGLPTAGQPGPNATGEGGDGDRDDGGTSGRERRTRSTGTTGATGRQSGSSGGQSRSSRQSRASGRAGATGATTSGGGASSGRTTKGASSTSTSTSTSASTSNSTPSSESTARRGLTRLQYGWLGVVLAGVVYLAGLWQYAGANAAALGSLRQAVAVDPAGALTATRLLAPGAFALDAASGGAGPELLFPAGVVALAVAFVAVVRSFGRGSAYLYLVGGLAPIVGLAAGPILALPDGAVLALVGVVPIVTTFAFVIDVGRYAVG